MHAFVCVLFSYIFWTSNQFIVDLIVDLIQKNLCLKYHNVMVWVSLGMYQSVSNEPEEAVV